MFLIGDRVEFPMRNGPRKGQRLIGTIIISHDDYGYCVQEDSGNYYAYRGWYQAGDLVLKEPTHA